MRFVFAKEICMPVPVRFLGTLLALLSLTPAARAGYTPPPARAGDDPIIVPVSCADGVTAAQLSMANASDSTVRTTPFADR